MVAEKKAKMPKSNPTTSTSILVAEVAAKYNEVPKKMTPFTMSFNVLLGFFSFQ